MRTAEDARRETEQNRQRAVAETLELHGIGPRVAAEVIEAYRAAEIVLPDECPHVDPKFGQCVREYGHEPFTEDETFGRVEKYDGHYTTQHNDPRRPDGSHPWDY